MARPNPFLRSVTLTDVNTTYNLATLLAAVDPDTPNHVQMLQLQLEAGAGGDILYIGNGTGDISADNGAELLAGQAWKIESLSSNLILTSSINLRSNGAGNRVNVTMVTR